MQNRITDHRISYSIYNRLREFLDGEIDEITQKLMEQERRKYLEGEDEENKDNHK
jgi:protein subunit release factor A